MRTHGLHMQNLVLLIWYITSNSIRATGELTFINILQTPRKKVVFTFIPWAGNNKYFFINLQRAFTFDCRTECKENF